MSYSARTGFNPVTLLGWIRSEVAEGYRPTRTPGLMYDPWFGADSDYRSAWAGAPVVVAW